MGVDKAYFTVGNAVTTYDLEADQVIQGGEWQLDTAWSGLPLDWGGSIGAAIDLGWEQLYVFKGAEYVRIPFATQAVDDGYPRQTQEAWSGLSFETIDAAMNWGDGKVYFFQADQYVRYDIAVDRQDPGYPKAIAAGWSGVGADWVGDGIDGALNPGNGRAYLLKGSEYVGIDWHTKSQLDGYPLGIADNWPGLTGLYDAVWSNAAPPMPAGGERTSTAVAFCQRFGAYADASEAATGVPSLVTLGQAALESGWGASAPGNNFFGIKAKATDAPETRQLLRTTEVLSRPDAVFPEVISVTRRSDGKYLYVVRDWFRVFSTPEEAFTGHGRFLRNNARYAPAFEHTDDPYAFAKAVAVAGYATAPNYYDSLSRTMRTIEASR
ncbi:glucosaminidase domain-containing protein [Streptomyces sp. NPDC094149]|uniref:glucosaminidase domain-containing protein n=1 Tax=Streptomyces sp. NPDC094149 TaxID=3155079 RepID=UPI00331A83B2